ncbi:MAG: glutamate formiminotransferase [Actinomycetia bacterium]|nr:glutamate formiminotransferase [Actinomycetes bacterium]
MYECVANVSEGRDEAVLGALDAAAGDALLDRHSDADHHRSVFTLADPSIEVVSHAARSLARAVAAAIDLTRHSGVHPRFGALDVVPFVTLDPRPGAIAATVEHARGFAAWAASELGIPAFLYDLADPLGRDLPTTRRDAFTDRAPDMTPDAERTRLGAVAVGARDPLVAVNVELERGDLELARAVARAVRARNGGLPGVRSLAFPLPSSGRVQVSMNLVDLDATGLEAACGAVRSRVEARGGAVHRIELVGLIPASELPRCSKEFRLANDLGPAATVEGRWEARGRPR